MSVFLLCMIDDGRNILGLGCGENVGVVVWKDIRAALIWLDRGLSLFPACIYRSPVVLWRIGL